MYNTIKKYIPASLRSLLKPLYQKWSLRNFTAPEIVVVRDDSAQFAIALDRQNGAVDEYIFIHRNWEPQVGRVLHEHLAAGGVFVDVGANIGYFSLLAAAIVSESGKVVAFEPLPQLVKQIRRSAAENNYHWLQVIPKALGDTPGAMQLSVAVGNIGGSSLAAPERAGARLEVEVSTLDTELADLERIDVMKIDVEGFEYEMLLGAQAVLTRCRPVLVLEFSPSFYDKRSESMGREILLSLIHLGYTCTILQTKTTSSDVDELLQLIAGNQVDLLCTIAEEEKE